MDNKRLTALRFSSAFLRQKPPMGKTMDGHFIGQCQQRLRNVHMRLTWLPQLWLRWYANMTKKVPTKCNPSGLMIAAKPTIEISVTKTYPGTKRRNSVLLISNLIEIILFYQIFHTTEQSLWQHDQIFCTGFIDAFLSLFVLLNCTKWNITNLC